MNIGIKICGDPHCDAIFHNIPKKVTKCHDCNGKLISINEETYQKKFYKYCFQYDYSRIDETDINEALPFYRPIYIPLQPSLFDPV